MSKILVLSTILLAGALALPIGCTASGASETSSIGQVEQALEGGPTPTRGSLVISQVYGGGGGTNAPFKNDYVEIFNRSSATITLDGLSIQYAAQTSDFAAGNVHPLSGSIPSGGYFLVALAGAGGSGDTLPNPDDTGSLILNASDGKVALAATTDPLNCGGVNRCGTKPLDLVGYGASSDWEGAEKVPALDATKAAVRKQGGCTDADNNRNDFAVEVLGVDGGAAPRNSTTAPAPCAVDAGTRDSGPTPPVVDPPLGEESPYDAGVRRDAGAASKSAGASDSGCAVSAPGEWGGGDVAALGGLGVFALILSARRRRR